LAVIPPVYRTGATYGRLFKQPLRSSPGWNAAWPTSGTTSPRRTRMPPTHSRSAPGHAPG